MSTSRYDPLNTAKLGRPGKETIVYLRRRFLPQPESFGTRTYRVVEQSDAAPPEPPDPELGGSAPERGTRLDILAWEELQDAEMFWFLCDANRAMRPDDLEIIRTVLRIPLPEGIPSPAHD